MTAAFSDGVPGQPEVAAALDMLLTQAALGPVRRFFQASDDVTADADEWRRATATQQGSWWPDYAAWLAARSGGQVAAPESPGSQRFPVIEPAPGSYVRAA